MARIPFFRRHNTYRQMADAYLDGELRPGELARFEAHSAGCEECAAMLAAGRTLKRAMGAIPEVAPPRSFRITPALLAERNPAPAAVRVSPLLLVSRVGAAASVAAFLVVGTLQVSTGGQSNDSIASSPMYELSGGGQADRIKDDSGDADPATDSGGEVSPLATEEPSLAPPSSPVVGGAGVEDSPTTETAPDETPQVAAGSEPTVTGEDMRNQGSEGPAEGFNANDGVLTISARESDDGRDYLPLLAVLGGVSVVALGTMGTLEMKRRRV